MSKLVFSSKSSSSSTTTALSPSWCFSCCSCFLSLSLLPADPLVATDAQDVKEESEEQQEKDSDEGSDDQRAFLLFPIFHFPFQAHSLRQLQTKSTRLRRRTKITSANVKRRLNSSSRGGGRREEGEDCHNSLTKSTVPRPLAPYSLSSSCLPSSALPVSRSRGVFSQRARRLEQCSLSRSTFLASTPRGSTQGARLQVIRAFS